MKQIINSKIVLEIESTNPFTGATVLDKDGNPVMKVEETTTAKWIDACIKRPDDMRNGFSYEEIENNFEVRQYIKAEKDGIIEVDHKVLEYIQKKVKQMTWGVDNYEIVRFKKYIDSIGKDDKK